MRDDIYAHLQRLPPAFHDDWQSGQLLSRATNDLSAIRRFAGFGIVFLITNTVTFIAVIAAADPAELVARPDHRDGLRARAGGQHPLPAALPGTVPALPGPAGRPGHLRGRGGDRDPGAQGARPGRRGRRAAHASRPPRCTGPSWRRPGCAARFWAGLDLIPNALIGVLLLLGAIATSRHELTLGGLVAFITLTLHAGVADRVDGLHPGRRPGGGHRRPADLRDPGHRARHRQPGRAARPGPRGRPAGAARPARLVFDHVGFTLPGRGAAFTARRDAWPSSRARPSSLAGATGAGKTTLLHLVPRLADVTSGAVLLDGTDVRRLPLPVLRSRVGCAFEDPTLFSASVRENVSYGAPGRR